MADSVCMESFYTQGTYTNTELGVYAGWKCHASSFSDCLPVTNEKRDITLLFVGENYMDVEDLDKLKGRNHRFSKNNASYLVHMYEEWGDDFLPLLNGRFHGLVIDSKRKRVLLFNDRFGLQRTYYFEGRGALYFSSEAKAILAVAPETRRINMTSLAEFISCDCLLDDKSLFENVCLLPGGASWSFSGHERAEKKVYFDFSVLDRQPLLETEFLFERLVSVLQKILPRYFRTDSKLGIPSGYDLNTRALLANAKFGPKKLAFYTIGSFSEHAKAFETTQKVSEALGQEHEFIDLGNDFCQRFYEFMESSVLLSDGAMDINGAADLYASRKARELAVIHIMNWGAEILSAESSRGIGASRFSLFSPEFQHQIDEALKRYKQLAWNDRAFKLGKGIAWRGQGKRNIEESQFGVRTPFLDNDFVQLLFRATDEVFAGGKVPHRLIRGGNPALEKLDTRAGKRTWRILSRIRTALREDSKVQTIALWPNGVRPELSRSIVDVLLDRRSLERPYLNGKIYKKTVSDLSMAAKGATSELVSLLTIELFHRLIIEGNTARAGGATAQ